MALTRKTILALAFALAAAAPGASFAASACRNANGKFIKCPVQVTTPATRCKDSAGKFAKCSAPGATPLAAPHAATTNGATPNKQALIPPVKPTKSPINPANGNPANGAAPKTP